MRAAAAHILCCIHMMAAAAHTLCCIHMMVEAAHILCCIHMEVAAAHILCCIHMMVAAAHIQAFHGLHLERRSRGLQEEGKSQSSPSSQALLLCLSLTSFSLLDFLAVCSFLAVHPLLPC